MERRPIASRNTRWADAIAHRLAATCLTPNSISVLGVVFAAGAGVCFYFTSRANLPAWPFWISGALLVQSRLLANLFDGMVAQVQESSSKVGELYNEIPDRFSDAFILTGFGLAAGGDFRLGLAASALAILVAYVRAQMAVSGVPQQYIGPMAKAHRMALITAAALISAILPQYPVPTATLWILIAGCAITIFRRLMRGATHLKTS